jgi:hypothetical protein
MIEAARSLTSELHMRHLILPYRDILRPIDQDIRRLQQRIAEKSVGREVPVRQLLLLVLVRRHALEPAQGRHHRQQQMQFRVLRHQRLNEQRGLIRIYARGQPVDDHIPGILLHLAGCLVVRRQRVPVGDEIQAGVLRLQPDPVLQHSVIVPEV